MSTLKYMVSPEDISYADYCEVIRCAYEDSKKKFDIDSSTGSVSPELLENLINNKQGVVFAAFDDKTLVAGAVLIRYPINTWYHQGQICETKYLAVHPRYQRKGIAKQLKSMIFEYAKANGFDCIISTINANNIASIKLQKSDGYYLVDTYIGYHLHKTIKMVKWFTKPPYCKMFYIIRYNIKRFYINLVLKFNSKDAYEN